MATIILDCPPGSARPNVVLNHIFATLHLPIHVTDTPYCRSFGEWTFKFDENDTKTLRAHKSEIGDAIRKAYDNGDIRYGEWDM